LLSARKVSAEEAYSLGLVQYVIPCAELEQAVQGYAHQVAQNSVSAIALTKSLLAAAGGMSLEAGLEYAASMNALARGTEDMKRGIAKFLAKSSPSS